MAEFDSVMGIADLIERDEPGAPEDRAAVADELRKTADQLTTAEMAEGKRKLDRELLRRGMQCESAFARVQNYGDRVCWQVIEFTVMVFGAARVLGQGPSVDDAIRQAMERLDAKRAASGVRLERSARESRN